MGTYSFLDRATNNNLSHILALLDVSISPKEPSGLELTKDGGTNEPIFIAENLFNSKDIWDNWSKQVLALVDFRECTVFGLSCYMIDQEF